MENICLHVSYCNCPGGVYRESVGRPPMLATICSRRDTSVGVLILM